jgi:hypothetical protein
LNDPKYKSLFKKDIEKPDVYPNEAPLSMSFLTSFEISEGV